MRRIKSAIDTQSTQFLRYQKNSLFLGDRLRDNQEKARFQRPKRDIERLRKQKKTAGQRKD